MMIRSLNDTFTIPLTQNQVALVDERDWCELRKSKWYAWWNKHTKSFYAKRIIALERRRTAQYMHRRILGLEHGDKRQGDHRNHNTLDNRRSNLRIVTSRANHENQRNQSKYGPGVEKVKKNRPRPFRARARVDDRTVHIGFFSTPEEARSARECFLSTGQKPPGRCSLSPYGPGITKRKHRRIRPFAARANVGGRRVHIGYYATADEARAAREEFLRRVGEVP